MRLHRARQHLDRGLLAAAAYELEAAGLLGESTDDVRARLVIERPAGRRWDFAPYGARVLEAIAPEVPDAWFPRVRVRSEGRSLPLVIVLGPPCSACGAAGRRRCVACGGAGEGELAWPHGGISRTTCSSCDGSGELGCGACAGTGFAIERAPLYKRSSCAHPVREPEGDDVSRCSGCGLASHGGRFACSTCGRFACACGPSAGAGPCLRRAVAWKKSGDPDVAGTALVDGMRWEVRTVGEVVPFYALLVDGREVEQFEQEDWPPGWTRPR